jgi:hypothetical protein
MTTSVIVAGARTPVGKLMGSLKDFSGIDLGAIAISGALQKAGVPASAVEYVIMGQVLTAGAGQMPARQAAVAAGIGWDVPALTINKMCLSGIDAIALADQLIRAGEFDVVVAGGQESMTQAPHLLMNSRAGYKYGDVTVLDHMAYDGLHDVFTDQPRTGLPPARTKRPPPHGKTAYSPTRWCPSRSRSAMVTRWRFPTTRASAPTPPQTRWQALSRRSVRTAPSQRGRRHKSPTEQPPSS